MSEFIRVSLSRGGRPVYLNTRQIITFEEAIYLLDPEQPNDPRPGHQKRIPGGKITTVDGVLYAKETPEEIMEMIRRNDT